LAKACMSGQSFSFFLRTTGQSSPEVTDGRCFAGCWNNMTFCLWGRGVELLIDSVTLALTGQIKIYANLLADVGAENLFLRRQLALYQERKVDPRRIDPATRITLALLSRLFNWRDALVVVQPKTLIRWHRAGFRLLWHWKSKPGRPPIPAELRRLIREMSRDNLLWGEERIANELLVKLGIRVSPRTVRKYMRRKPGRGPRGDQRWRTFLRNHAAAIVACDFFVIIEHASRRLLHWNVASNPTAAWTLQQLRAAG
jgi:putative transposase